MVPLASMQFVIEAVSDHTHVLFFIFTSQLNIQGDLFSGKNSLKRPSLEKHWT